MAFSDLCHISNAYKAVENEPDLSDRIMEENSMVRDLITKILDETGPSDTSSSLLPPEKTMNSIPSHYPKTDPGPTSYLPPSYNYPDNLFYNQNNQNTYNYNLQNGFSNNEFNFPEDNSNLLGIDTVDTSVDAVTPEQLNLLRLAAQEIGGAQFQTPNKFEDKSFNYFDSQRTQDAMFGFNRPNSLNLDVNFNNYDNFNNRYSYEKSQSSDSSDILSYLSQLNVIDRRDDTQNMDFKMPMDMNSPYQNEEFNKLQDNKAFFNPNHQQMPPKNYNGDNNNFYLNEMIKQMDCNPMNQSFDFQNQTPVSGANPMNFKPNGYHQNEFMQRQNQLGRENFQNVPEQRNFDGPMGRDNMQQANIARQNQELARQMALLMRNRPPPNPLNVDVSFLHENAPFNVGLGALLGPNAGVAPSPLLDLPLLAPFYAMRNMRGAATSSAILHLRLDACYEQWRQLERERKRTEARLALAYPGRAVSSANSIPVPRLPPCPTRVDRLTIDMLREHTKVLTLMGKMETLRASVCVSQRRFNHKHEDAKVTVLKRGEKDVDREKAGPNSDAFDPSTWREDIKNLSEIAPHSEVESAMLAWRGAVAGVQAARRRELHAHRYRADPTLQLAAAVKALALHARRARAAMWSDLTLTVALAPSPHHDTRPAQNEKPHLSTSVQVSPKQNSETGANVQTNSKTHPTTTAKEEKSQEPAQNSASKAETKENSKSTSKTSDKPQDKNQQRKTQHYRHKVNANRNDFYQKNQRYDSRFMPNRHPYYLATGPIN